MSTDAETTENVEPGVEVTFLDDSTSVPERQPTWPAPLPPLDAGEGEGLLASHLCMTAPERDGFFLPMDGFELRQDSCKLYRDLNPRNALEGMLATLAVGIFNTSLIVVADGSRQETPLEAREINLRYGLKAATVAVDLLKALNELQNGTEKRVSVGAVNVEAGGQAIVGNVDARKRGRKAGRQNKRQARNLGR